MWRIVMGLFYKTFQTAIFASKQKAACFSIPPSIPFGMEKSGPLFGMEKCHPLFYIPELVARQTDAG